MSSTYRILCLSHDPALVIETPDWNRPTPAEEAIRNGVDGHEQCDLMIGRYSYPLVELGCPRSADRPDSLRPDVLRCCHGSTTWTTKEWLLLLTAAHQSPDPAIREAIKAGSHHCLPWERLRRLRDELGITITPPAITPQLANHEPCSCGQSTPLITADSAGLHWHEAPRQSGTGPVQVRAREAQGEGVDRA
jgi:hypothetical protein